MADNQRAEDHQAARMALQFLESQSRPLNADELLLGAGNMERPCSGPSRVTCNIRFINRASCKVDVYWISRKGLSSLYQILQPNKAMLVSTYAGHLWHFCHVRGTQVEWLQADQEFVYNVQEMNGLDGRPVVQDVVISLPLYSLQDWCKRLIVRQVKKDDIQHLKLPSLMKDMLEIFTSHSNLISEQLKAVDSVSLVKKRKDQLIHLFGHLIRGMFIRQTFTQLSPIWGNWLQNMNQVDNLNQLREMFTTLGQASGLDDLQPAGPADPSGEELAGYANIIQALSNGDAQQRSNDDDEVGNTDGGVENNPTNERDDSSLRRRRVNPCIAGSSSDPQPHCSSRPPPQRSDAISVFSRNRTDSGSEQCSSNPGSSVDGLCHATEPVAKRLRLITDNDTDSENPIDSESD